jgi:uncharacterized protein (TIGR02246 family)
VPESPVAAVLAAIDALDLDAFASLFAPDGRLLTVDGRVATGIDEVRQIIREFAADLRATNHEVTAEWHPDPDVWIAELDATYELTNYARLGPYPRAMILRNGSGGIHELRIYGLHERPLVESTRPYQEVFGSGHWLPTL